MSSQPYQPFLLRVLHGLTGIFLVLAMISAFWTYNVYDGRWGQLPLPVYREIEGIHGTFGLYTLIIFPVFVRYAFGPGRWRLVQSDSAKTLTRLGQPIWWYTVNRFTNTFALLALTFALFSGKMMDSTWLPKGELDHRWYLAHLVAWVVMAGAIALHVLLNLRIGGLPWVCSMWTRKKSPQDSLQHWRPRILAVWSTVRQCRWVDRLHWLIRVPRLELAIEGAVISAWIISLFKEFVL